MLIFQGVIDLLQINEGHLRHQDGHQTPRVFCWENLASPFPLDRFVSGDIEETALNLGLDFEPILRVQDIVTNLNLLSFLGHSH